MSQNNDNEISAGALKQVVDRKAKTKNDKKKKRLQKAPTEKKSVELNSIGIKCFFSVGAFFSTNNYFHVACNQFIDL